jgi:Cu(I)/Ag(I) efflux system membrane fusion protein
MDWDAMTMDFRQPKSGVPKGIKVGDRIHFEFVMSNEGPQLISIRPIDAVRKQK